MLLRALIRRGRPGSRIRRGEFLALAPLWALLVLAGCDDPAPSPTDAAGPAPLGQGPTEDAGERNDEGLGQSPPGDAAPPLQVDPRDARALVFVPGMVATGERGLIEVTLLEATPPPPLKGQSQWSLLVRPIDGTRPEGARVTVVPRMPDHGHGSGTTVVVTSGPQSGQYQAAPVNLFMPGYWLTTVNVELADGRTDQARFGFVIGG